MPGQGQMSLDDCAAQIVRLGDEVQQLRLDNTTLKGQVQALQGQVASGGGGGKGGSEGGGVGGVGGVWHVGDGSPGPSPPLPLKLEAAAPSLTSPW